MLKRLLVSVNNVWSTQAKEHPIFILRQSNGQHTHMTMHAGQLHFHSTTYHETLPVKQSIVLEDLTLAELGNIVIGMGYTIEVLPGQGHFAFEGAVLLMDFKDIPITDGYEVTVFTASVWRFLYPIARLLEDVEGDVDLAMQQMYLRTSKSKWLDYWASFFGVNRFIGEVDNALIKRIVLFLVNPKTNNRSMEESIELTLGLSDIKVTDVAPAFFQVELTPEAISMKDTLDKLLQQLKAGGVDYIYHYSKTMTENYSNYLWDATGKPVSGIDGASPIVHVGMLEQTEDFRLYPGEDIFTVNVSDVNGPQRLMSNDRVREGMTMVMRGSNGEVVKSLS